MSLFKSLQEIEDASAMTVRVPSDQPEEKSFVHVVIHDRFQNWFWEGDVEVKSGVKFRGELIQKGSRIADDRRDLVIFRFDRADNGDIVAQDKNRTKFINIAGSYQNLLVTALRWRPS